MAKLQKNNDNFAKVAVFNISQIYHFGTLER